MVIGMLCRAVIGRHSVTIPLLLDAGADPNLGDSLNRTPLQYAAHLGSAHTVRLLLKAGANTSVRDPHWGTTLHIIVSRQGRSMLERSARPVSVHLEDGRSCVAIATALLDAGADIHATNGHSQSAMALAIHYKLYDFAMLLSTRTPDVACWRRIEGFCRARRSVVQTRSRRHHLAPSCFIVSKDLLVI